MKGRLGFRIIRNSARSCFWSLVNLPRRHSWWLDRSEVTGSNFGCFPFSYFTVSVFAEFSIALFVTASWFSQIVHIRYRLPSSPQFPSLSYWRYLTPICCIVILVLSFSHSAPWCRCGDVSLFKNPYIFLFALGSNIIGLGTPFPQNWQPSLGIPFPRIDRPICLALKMYAAPSKSDSLTKIRPTKSISQIFEKIDLNLLWPTWGWSYVTTQWKP